MQGSRMTKVISFSTFLAASCRRSVQYAIKKTSFAQRVVEILGFMISDKGKHPHPKKIKKLKEWLLPETSESLNSFRCFANFIREFIPDFHVYAEGFKKYCKKGVNFKEFKDDQLAANSFYKLRKAVAEDVPIVNPDFPPLLIIGTQVDLSKLLLMRVT